MKNKFLTSAILVLTLTLAACAPKASTGTKATSIPSAKPPVHTPTAVPTTKPNNTPAKPPASTSTPLASLLDKIVISDQPIKSNTVLVNMVVTQQRGWVVIFSDQNGQPGVVLGFAVVPAGTSNDVKVNIDAAKATDKMIAELHMDAGKIGTFEFPGPDMPFKNGDTNVTAVFNKATAGSSQKLIPQ